MDQIVKTINPDTLVQHIDITADSWRLDTADDDLAVTLAGPGGFLGQTITITKFDADNEASVTPLNGLIGGESSYTFTSPSSITIQSDGQFGDNGNWEIIATTNVAISPDLIIGAGQSITYSAEEYDGTGSFQPIGPDLNLDAAAGSSTDPKYIAVIMGNVLGATLSKTKTYIGALIGKYSITGTRGSTYPQGAVIGEVADGVTTADGSFVAVLGGDSELTTANAAYGVDNQNSTPNSGFAYGLDLYKATHDGYPAIAYRTGNIRFSDQSVQNTGTDILKSYLATTVTYNNTAALAATALSVTVVASGKYAISLVVHSTSAVKALLLDFGGTATATNFIGEWMAWETPIDIGTPTAGVGERVTTAGADFNPSALDTKSAYFTFNGSVEINAAGTFLLRGAQNLADVSNTTILRGSTLILTRMA